VNSSAIEVTRHPGWALLRIAREDKRNAMDRATRSGLAAALAELARPGGEVRAIVITGRGASFCAGLDLKERSAEQAAGVPDTAGMEWLEINMALRRHPAVCIAAVNGLALGAGVTLINSCDLALASDDASIGCPEIGFASYASMAGPTLQLSGLSRKRAAWMLLTAPRIDALTAERWGLINEVVPADALLTRASALATQIAGYDAAALAEIKQTLDHIPAQVADWRGAMEYGQSVNAAIRARTGAAAAGLAHFALAGRSPDEGD